MENSPTIPSLIICLVLFNVAQPAEAALSSPHAVIASAMHDFGRVKQGEKVVHEFVLRNDGEDALTIAGVHFSHPGMSISTTSIIPPGQTRSIRIEWDTSQVAGEMEAETTLLLNDPAQPSLPLVLRGYIVPPIEVLPLPIAFLSAYASDTAEWTVQIVNNQDHPVTLTRLEIIGEFFDATLRTTEAGRTYEIMLASRREMPPGRYKGLVYIQTDDQKHPRLTVPVNLFVKPHLYARPDVVNFGLVSLKRLARQPNLLPFLSKQVLVKRRDEEFAIISVKTDVPFLDIRQDPPERSQTFRFDVGLNLERIVPGKIDGTIRIETDDPEFPELVVPVHGEIKE